MSRILLMIPFCLLITGCNSTPQDSPPPIAESNSKETPIDNEFRVKFETTAGDFTMLVHRDWAPRGAERFHELIENQYYDDAPFYRVVPGFMVQFGMNADPKITQQWDRAFPDDPVTQSNQPGTVSYATSGPNSRSTQLFINYGNNARLDGMGFSPFAEIIDGMNIVNAINSQYGEQPSQQLMTMRGNEYVKSEFPRIDYIVKARFLDGETDIETTPPETAGDPTSSQNDAATNADPNPEDK